MRAVIASILLDLSLAAAAVGAICLVRPLAFLGVHRRGAGAVLFAAALAAATLIALWPASTLRSDGHQAIDRFLPSYNFHELHQTRVHASPEAVYRATLEVTADEIRWLKPLLAIRQFPASLRKRLGRDSARPILEIATKSSFFYLAREPSKEIVVGTVGRFWTSDGGRSPGIRGPEEFLAFKDQNFARVAMNFTIEDAAGGFSLLTTETRIFAPEGAPRRRFAAYWRLIYPGSSLIRVGWLEGIRKRAEAG
ncbi:MAG: hypothetical protein ACRD00_03075 [Thermoanaerobaculia bacterium]